MNRVPLLLLGIFLTLAFSWTGIVLTNQLSYGNLAPVYDENEDKTFPLTPTGLAMQGRQVYEDLGCIHCHTQQVRRPGFGVDDKRGWGERQSVARDYIREGRVLLGAMRTGPDLRNAGARYVGESGREWHIRHLYDPTIVTPRSIMPPFAFLFETREIIGQPAPNAIQSLLPDKYQPPAGHEIVPTHRADALIGYLLALNDSYTYPQESRYIVYDPAPATAETAATETTTAAPAADTPAATETATAETATAETVTAGTATAETAATETATAGTADTAAPATAGTAATTPATAAPATAETTAATPDTATPDAAATTTGTTATSGTTTAAPAPTQEPSK